MRQAVPNEHAAPYFSHRRDLIKGKSLASLSVMFACLIIYTFQLVFSVGKTFFSHNKSAGIVFRLVFQRSEHGLKVLTLNMLQLLQYQICSNKLSIKYVLVVY